LYKLLLSATSLFSLANENHLAQMRQFES